MDRSGERGSNPRPQLWEGSASFSQAFTGTRDEFRSVRAQLPLIAGSVVEIVVVVIAHPPSAASRARRILAHSIRRARDTRSFLWVPYAPIAIYSVVHTCLNNLPHPQDGKRGSHKWVPSLGRVLLPARVPSGQESRFSSAVRCRVWRSKQHRCWADRGRIRPARTDIGCRVAFRTRQP